ncbi:restriction endonuclease subunit S [Aeromonas rivipollensis]
MAEQMIQHKEGEKVATLAIPTGYKQTEVGVIPEDWECKHIGELADVVRGGSPRPAGDARFFNGNFIPWLTVASLTNISPEQMYVVDTATKLTELGSLRSRVLNEDTLIISNSGATLGVAKILKIKCCANDGVAALVNQCLGNKIFLAHYINTQTKKLQEQIATGNGQPNLNTDLIRVIPVPFPREAEQAAIANVLSDTDALIAGLEQLIAKKQAIKTASMQQLLTGRTRLPQFARRPDGAPKGYKSSELGQIPEDWEVSCIGDKCHTYSGGTPSTSNKDYYGGSIRWITSSDLNKGQIFEVEGRITDSGLKFSSAKEIKAGSFLIALYGATAGVCAISHVDAAINQAVLAVVPRECSSKYLFYWFSMNKSKIIEIYTQGGQPNLSGDIIRSVALPFPLKEEQTAIATILSDMDNELQALTQKLEKARALKQGMMQQLLTGRIRLPLPQEA